MGMLVMTRRDGESFFITKDIQIRVLSVNGNQVRIGVEAPKDMNVYREELRERFEAQDTAVDGNDDAAEAAA